MDGENEKGKRAEGGGKKGEGQAEENMRVRASLSEKGGGRREEEGGRREEGGEKPIEKYARASKCQLFHALKSFHHQSWVSAKQT